MTNTEFAEVVGYIESGCGKLLPVPSKVVYFDLLGDLPYDLGMLAARRVLLEHKWATFPSVAELRAAAVESARGEVKELSGAEAWAMAWWVAANTDPEIAGSFERACGKAKAPPLVVEAVRAMSLLDLCFGKEPVGVLRGQFLKVFDQLQSRDRRAALLPPAVRAELADIRDERGLEGRGRPALVNRLAESFALPE